MLINNRVNLPYYGNFNLFINFHESKSIKTCGVNVSYGGMNFFYNSDFLNRLSQKEVNFVVLHEDFHLLWDHVGRTSRGKFDRKLSNIAQDMIINHIIWQDIDKMFVEIPKDEDGKNMALFVPKEYNGKLVFEDLYNWLSEKRDQFKNKKEEDKDLSYGPHCKNPIEKNNNPFIDGWSLDRLLDNMEKNTDSDGYLDSHIDDEASEEYRDSIIKNSIERLKNRGLSSSNIEQTLDKLRKKKKDYLSYIKRSISNEIFGTLKKKTITKPNRKSIEGVKGKKKIKNVINCILDTSGSMGGTFDKVLSIYIEMILR
jgi:predicted metal-dependent peptidase